MTKEKKNEEKPKSRHSSENATGDDHSLFEKVVPDGLKRGFETVLKEGRLKNLIGELKLPKEIVNYIMAQVDDTKQAAIGVVSREVRLFLEQTNLAEEIAKLLTLVSFEIKTQVRFVPSDKTTKKDKKEQADKKASKIPFISRTTRPTKRPFPQAGDEPETTNDTGKTVQKEKDDEEA